MELLLASLLLVWLAVVAVVVGMCAAAARGDRDSLGRRGLDLASLADDGERYAAGPAPAGRGGAPVG